MSTVVVPPRHFIGSLTRLVWQWVRQQIHAEVLAAGFDDLNPAHVALFRNPGLEGRRPGELADEMNITKQSVNELLGHLERRGYLVREVDPVDSRSRRLHLTGRGREISVVIVGAAEGAERAAGELIGEDRMAEVVAALTDLVGLLGLSSYGPTPSTQPGLAAAAAPSGADGVAEAGPTGETATDGAAGDHRRRRPTRRARTDGGGR
jgi:DNA-binding MarR family transcriptional regulator